MEYELKYVHVHNYKLKAILKYEKITFLFYLLRLSPRDTSAR